MWNGVALQPFSYAPHLLMYTISLRSQARRCLAPPLLDERRITGPRPRFAPPPVSCVHRAGTETHSLGRACLRCVAHERGMFRQSLRVYSVTLTVHPQGTEFPRATSAGYPRACHATERVVLALVVCAPPGCAYAHGLDTSAPSRAAFVLSFVNFSRASALAATPRALTRATATPRGSVQATFAPCAEPLPRASCFRAPPLPLRA